MLREARLIGLSAVGLHLSGFLEGAELSGQKAGGIVGHGHLWEVMELCVWVVVVDV